MLRWKSLSVVVGLLFAGALVAAQTSKQSSTTHFKTGKDQVILSDDVRVGSTLLKSGRYEVKSSSKGLTFRHMVQDVAYTEVWNYDTEEQPVVVKVAKATPLPEKAIGTELDMPADSQGVHVLKAVTIDGTNVKLTVAQ